MIKNVAILGSTGSIGSNALKVISDLEGKFKVVALAADSNIALLSRQALKFRPRIISVGSEPLAGMIKKGVPDGMKVVCGVAGLNEIVSRPDVDIVLFAISGSSCLMPLLEAIAHAKRIALANKEALVSAGDIVMSEARKRKAEIIPIDSEHSAIFQCLEGRRPHLSKIYLTGSGGPLLHVNRERFGSLSKEFVLNHPRWKMGKKISVDSATMMNKGLEIIEAKHLFGLDERMIEVLIHPEAVIHSMVEMTDGTVFAQMGVADMRLPIQYALTFPERLPNSVGKLDFFDIKSFSFLKPDMRKFPCLALAREAARSGGTDPAVLNAADEVAVGMYLEGAIKFTDIPRIIGKVLSRNRNTVKRLKIADVIGADAWAREEAMRLCQ